LARVDDVPNVMTCRVPAEEGTRVETQNVAGTRETDLLRAADWFFPEGMNHHELLAGVPGAGRMMQAMARQIAGLGRLPKEAKAPVPARRRQADVLVVGGGPAGMAAALELGARGRAVEVVDDGLVVGGSLGALAGDARRPWDAVERAFEEAVSRGRVTLRLRTTAAGVYADDVLLAAGGGVEVVTARSLVLAPGAHDGAVAFEGNDLPGVVSARAAGWLHGYGVRLGARVVVAVAPGGGPFGAAFAAARQDVTRVDGLPGKATGRTRVRTVEVNGRELACDLLVVDAPRAPAYELCAQAGAELAHTPYGFVVRTGSGGRIREGVFACGEVAGTAFEPEPLQGAAKALADAAG
jgi:sarcosine oxidase subunit alpha